LEGNVVFYALSLDGNDALAKVEVMNVSPSILTDPLH
jgi:hypothetical protein